MRKIIFCFFTLFYFCNGFSQNIVPPVKQADSLFITGLELFKKKKYEQSAEILMEARAIATKKPGRESALYGDIVHYLGTDYQGLNRSEDALPFLLEALDIRRQVLGHNHPDCGKTLNNLALVNINLGKLKEAEGYAIDALLLKEKAPGKESIEYGNSQNTLALVLEKRGQFIRADSVIADLLERRKRLLGGEENAPYANALNFKANLETLLYRFEEAERSYRRALEIMKKISGDRSFQYLSVFINLGQLYAKMGQYDLAETTQRACLQLAAELLGKDSREYALALRNLGFVLQAQGRFKESLPVLEEALERATRIYGPENPETAQILGNQASAYFYLGDYEKSAQLLKNELEVFEKSERRDDEYYRVLLNYGTTLKNLEQYEQAEKYLLQAEATAVYLQLPIEKLSALYHNFGVLYLGWGKLTLAEQWLLKAIDAIYGKKSVLTGDEVSVFFRLAQLYQMKSDYQQTLRYAKEGQLNLEKSISRAVNYLSEAELHDAAAFFFSRNGSLLELGQYWNRSELNSVCYDNILFTKGFVLENAIKLRHAFEKEGSVDEAKWLKWKTLRRQIASEYSKPESDPNLIVALEQEANKLEKKLAGALDYPSLPHWREVQKALGQNEAAVEFVRYETENRMANYIAFILTANTPAPQAVTLCKEEDLIRLFEQEAYPLAAYYGEGGNSQLYELLIKPIMPFVGQAKQVWYAPAGLLHRINFQAMAVTKGHILSDTLDLILLGSTRQIVEKKSLVVKDRPMPSSALLLGGINYQSMNTYISNATRSDSPRGQYLPSNWPYLAASLNEVQSVQRLIKAANIPVTLVSDSSATEELVRQRCTGSSAPGILHIASHAAYVRDTILSPVRSVGQLNDGVAWWTKDPLLRVIIAMAGADYANLPGRRTLDDGILTAYEISLLELDGNQLAVVSACDSGLGDLDPHEGVWGLGRAFRIAGTQNVILSLWKANDTAAKDFMDAFYYKWIAEKSSIHEAFTAAQNELRKFNPDPRYWAGFILSE